MSPSNSGIPGTTQDNSFSTAPIAKMQKGTKVSWLAEGATIRGHGVAIADEDGDGTILVACDKGTFEYIPIAYHVVIHCTVTWLTAEQDAAPLA